MSDWKVDISGEYDFGNDTDDLLSTSGEPVPGNLTADEIVEFMIP